SEQAMVPPACDSSATQCGAPQGSVIAGSQAVGSINVQKYEQKLREHGAGSLFVDVRERDEFVEGHMPGAQNIPLSEVSLALESLSKAKRVYLSCLSGRRSSFAAETLAYLGFSDVVNVTGGFKAWLQAGLPVEKGGTRE